MGVGSSSGSSSKRGGNSGGRVALPVDRFLPELLAALPSGNRFLVQATPGSGKTTRIPAALADALPGAVYVLEPRRLAARLAATRVADENGVTLGQEVGYQFRFEKKRSPHSKIVFFTEGLFLKELENDPELKKVSAICLDEFHERHLATDLALGALIRLQETSRPDLKLFLLSATLESSRIEFFLTDRGAKPYSLKIEEKLHPLEIHFDGSDLRVGDRVERAFRKLTREGRLENGRESLVFLPGFREIRDAERKLKDSFPELDVAVLHAELPEDEMKRAFSENPRAPKVILSTNVAESSVTLPRVNLVVDAGLARSVHYRGRSGFGKRELGKISQASSIQRAGRAGRTGPGTVIRLYSEKDYIEMRPFEVPELMRSDPLEVAFALASIGFASAREFPTMEKLNLERLDEARARLERMGLVSGAHRTKRGMEIGRIPLSLRSALVFESARKLGVAHALIPLLVAIEEGDRLPKFPLEERIIVSSRGGSRLEAKLRDGLSPDSSEPKPETLLRSFLTSSPDRLAKVEPGLLRLASGPSFPFTDPEFKPGLYYLFDAEEKESANSIAVYACEAVELAWLEEHFPDDILFETETKVDLARRKETSIEREMWGKLVLQEWKKEKPLDLSELPAEHEVFEKLLGDLTQSQAEVREFWEEFLDRVSRLIESGRSVRADFISRMKKELVVLLGEIDLKDAILALDSMADADWLSINRELPRTIDLPRRKRVKVNYVAGKNPFLESRMQDFFGLKDGPRVLAGKTPITLHLLAPNYRAVQVTEDLMRFWAVHYPELRNPLMRRYPRHQWPEDPRQLIKDETE